MTFYFRKEEDILQYTLWYKPIFVGTLRSYYLPYSFLHVNFKGNPRKMTKLFKPDPCHVLSIGDSWVFPSAVIETDVA